MCSKSSIALLLFSPVQGVHGVRGSIESKGLRGRWGIKVFKWSRFSKGFEMSIKFHNLLLSPNVSSPTPVKCKMILIRSLSKLVLHCHWSWNTLFDLFQNFSLFIQVRERIASNLISGNNRAKSKIYKLCPRGLTASGMHFTLYTPPFLRKSTTSRHGNRRVQSLENYYKKKQCNGDRLVIFESQWWSAKEGISRIWRVTTHHTEIAGKTFRCLLWNAD